jgi:hypothetical protein
MKGARNMSGKATHKAKHADPTKVALQDALARLQAEATAGAVTRATLDAARDAIEAIAHKLNGGDPHEPGSQVLAGGALPPGSRRRTAK